jgi:hypothetical protein
MVTSLVLTWVLAWALAGGVWAQDALSAGGKEPFFDRAEFYGSYRHTDRVLRFTTPGPTPVKLDSELFEARGGVRVFSTQSPLPLLDTSYMWNGDDTDTTLFPPGPVTSSSSAHDHEFRLGAMIPVPSFGLFKIAADDMESIRSFGLYAVPQYRDMTGKFGVEWSENEAGPNDRLLFGMGTLPYGPWRFSLGFSDRLQGYWMGGGQVGREIGEFFGGAALYAVEHGDAAWALMLGRPAREGLWGPSFWAVYLNNPEYRRTNIMVALGKPGIPKEALDNPYSNGIYTAMFTDQMGTVVPIQVRNFEEGRIWMRPDEWAQAGYGDWGGLVLSIDAIDAAVGYKIFQAGLFYTRPKYGPLLCPHVGPIFESERLPDIGRQDWRCGLEFGTYLGHRAPTKFFKAGRVYLGVSALSDFEDYTSVMGELRLEL